MTMTSPFPQLTSPPQALAEVIFNEALETLEHQAVYGKRQETTLGLTWGYYGGRWGGFSVAAGTFTLAASSTTYIVVAIATGVISQSTTNTNWNDSTNYARVYKLTTGVAAVTAEEDHRGGPRGVSGGAGAAASFTGGTLTSAINEAPIVTLASASTVNIGAAAANTLTISGTTTITAFDTIASGARRLLVFGGALVLTHNATSLILPTGANITTAAGDTAEAVSLGSGNWRIVTYQRKDGSSLTAPASFTGGTLSSALNEAPIATLASASTVNIGAAAANTLSITGTTTVTAFDTIAAGARRLLVFTGILILTHNATSLILPTGANITTAAGDTAEVVSLGAGNWRVVTYQRKDGSSLVASSFTGGTLSSALNEAPKVTIASAGTVNIGAAASNSVTVSGTTTITAFDTIADGACRELTFSGALTLTHNATSLILPTGANITTAAGDVAYVRSLGAGNWRCVGYQRASGAALTGSSFTGGTLTSPINDAPNASIASAATMNIGAATSNMIDVSGSTGPVTAFDTIAAGARRVLIFASTPTLTHNATSLILPSGANIVCAAGDTAEFESLGSGNWRCLWFQRKSGSALISAGALTNFTEAANTSAPNTTITVVSLTPNGAASDMSIALVPKGTSGSLLGAIPNNLSSGGNARGTGAVDWQLTRSSAAQVASGVSATITGGLNNTASGNYSVASGRGNTAAAQDSAVVGGTGNFITSGASNSICGGNSHTIGAAATNSVAFGSSHTLGSADAQSAFGKLHTLTGLYNTALGFNNSVSGQSSTAAGEGHSLDADNSTALGLNGTSRTMKGSLAFASGQRSSVGDAQRLDAMLRKQTTNATQTPLTSTGGAAASTNQFKLPTTGVIKLTAHVTAINRGTGDVSVWEITAVCKQVSGTVSLVGAQTRTLISQDAGASTWAVDILADNTNKCIQLAATGVAATTIDWVASCTTVVAA